jgi:phage shock protein PspC (stress-responsive transcriptional regulator)
MKKIININLSGRVIPIEDSAYERLQRYIESLRQYFVHEESKDEIINDIESRIAELMNDKVKKGAAAVTEADIEEIINSMGRVEDFEQADAAQGRSSAEGATSEPFIKVTSTRGRLYRDKSDKILGGVCSGIANYMNVDPAIIRLLFAIITFGGFGFGILIYILMWIIIPARDLEGYAGKRLFRNPDDRIIAGVAGGLAAYFRKEAWIIRLVFAAPLILNILFGALNGIGHAFDWNFVPNVFIGSFTGTFIIAYIILWIVLPEARSPFEKMEMRGEKVDVNSIRQNVQAWGAEVKESAQNLGERAKEFASTRGKTFAAEVSQTARPIGTSLGQIIGTIFKIFFLFVAGTFAFALFVIVLVFTLGGMAQPFNDFLLQGFWQRASLWGTLVFFLAVPMIALITWIVRRLMKVRSQNRYLGYTFSGLWIIGWISLMIFISSMVRDFRFDNRVPEEVPVAHAAMSKMVVRVDEPQVEYSGTFSWMDNDEKGWDLTEDTLKASAVKIQVSRSEDSAYHVTVWRYSNGRTRNDALNRARQIVYHVSSRDSLLDLGSAYAIAREHKFRMQRVMVEISVPVGKMIRFDNTIHKLEDGGVRVPYNNRDWDRRWDNDWDNDWDDGRYFDWKSDVDYRMEETGELVEANLPAAPANGDVYEYRRNADDSVDQQTEDRDRIRKEAIEEQRRRVEEENRKLQELEQRRTPNTSNIEKRSKGNINTLQVHTPIFSLI